MCFKFSKHRRSSAELVRKRLFTFTKDSPKRVAFADSCCSRSTTVYGFSVQCNVVQNAETQNENFAEKREVKMQRDSDSDKPVTGSLVIP